MKFEMDRESLLEGLSKTVPIAEKKSPLPILSHVHLSVNEANLIFTATDLEVGLRIKYNCNMFSDGSTALPARKFFEIVRELSPGTVSFELDENNRAKIISGPSEFSLAAMDASDFPVWTDPDDTIMCSTAVPSERLVYLIEKTIFAASNDESRFNLNGVLFEQIEGKLRLVATDGHRLALIDEDLNFDLKSRQIVPKKGLLEMKRILENHKGEIKIGFEPKNMFVQTEQFTMNVRLIEGDFPDYVKVIPKQGGSVIKFGKVKLLQSLRRMSVFTSDRNRGVDVNLSKGETELTVKHPDLGRARDVIPVDYDGEDFALIINVDYLRDSLGAMDSEDITVEVNQPGAPIFIRPEPVQDYFNIVMPMKR